MTKLISCTFVAFISLLSVNSFAEDGEIVLKAAEQTRGETVETRTQLTLTTQFTGIEPDEID